MAQRTLQLDDEQYERFRALILERSGLHFPAKRRRDLERGLQQAFSQTDCPDLETYHRLLLQLHTTARQWEDLIFQLTVGETYFFRNRAQFEALREHVLPEIIARKRSLTHQLRIWSAGCATGEEPYSIAMLLRDLLPDLAKWHITILATDINREALDQARAGLYGAWSFREKGWEWMQERYFTHQGNTWQLAPEVREMVHFTYLNLVEDAYPSLANNTVAFDLILCRNVTIYFTPEITRHVVDHLYEALVEEGWLVVGHSEPCLETYAQFAPRNFPGAVLYQKRIQPARFDLSRLDALEQPLPAPSHAAPPVRLDSKPASAIPIVLSPPEPEAQEPPPTPADLCAEAKTFLNRGRTEEALERLQRALEQEPNYAPASYLVGKIWANAGRWEEARHWCEQAMEQDPLLAEAYFLLALVHSQEGNLGDALTAMKRVVYLDRGAVLGHFGLANLYRELGDEIRTQRSLRNTVRLLEDLPEEAAVPWSDGMTAGRLRYIVQRQMNKAGN